LAIALVAGWGCSRHPVRLAPPGSVTIYRDVWGAPHVYAEREEDGFWGVGYTTGEDHLEGVLLRYLALEGGLARAFGAGPVGEEVFSWDSHGVIEDANGTFRTPTRVRAGALDAWLLDVPGAIMGLKGHSRHYAWGWSEGPRRPADCIVLETIPGKPRTYLYDG